MDERKIPGHNFAIFHSAIKLGAKTRGRGYKGTTRLSRVTLLSSPCYDTHITYPSLVILS